MKKVAAFDLTNSERAQGIGLLTAAVCAINLLGSYGAEGSYTTNFERYGNLMIGVLGSR